MHRMKSEGLVESFWVEKAGERRRRYYRITQKGNKALEEEKQAWMSVHGIFVKLWGMEPGVA